VGAKPRLTSCLGDHKIVEQIDDAFNIQTLPAKTISGLQVYYLADDQVAMIRRILKAQLSLAKAAGNLILFYYAAIQDQLPMAKETSDHLQSLMLRLYKANAE